MRRRQKQNGGRAEAIKGVVTQGLGHPSKNQGQGQGANQGNQGEIEITQTGLFAYDEQGRLIGEYEEDGAPVQETLWLGDLPVATIREGVAYRVYADHLGTPRAVADHNDTLLWRWRSDPFGTTEADEDPDQDGQRFVYNLRFPGQYFDGETGRHYNYFRDYDPSTGRYVQSDPIGLAGGLSAYMYVNANPMYWIDPTGEKAKCSCKTNGTNKYITDPDTGKKGKTCFYNCSCSCQKTDVSWEDIPPFKTWAFSATRSRNQWDFQSAICLGQYSVKNKEFGNWEYEFKAISFETGLIEPSDFQKQYGVQPYEDGVCQISPELCRAAEKQCEDCE